MVFGYHDIIEIDYKTQQRVRKLAGTDYKMKAGYPYLQFIELVTPNKN